MTTPSDPQQFPPPQGSRPGPPAPAPGAATPPVSSPPLPSAALPDMTEFITNPGKPPRDTPSKAPLYLGLGVAGIALLAVGFFAGRAVAAGPQTLADALSAAQAGTLPCGTPTTPPTAAGGVGAPGAGGNASTFLIARLCHGGQGRGAAAGAAAGAGGGAGFAGGGRGVGGLFGPGAVTGNVTSVSGDSLTVQTRGGVVTVTVPGTAKVSVPGVGSVKDIKTGQTVVITTGTANGTSTGTATAVTVLPASGAAGRG